MHAQLALQLVHGLQSDQLSEGDWEGRVLSLLSASSGAVTRLDETTLSVRAHTLQRRLK